MPVVRPSDFRPSISRAAVSRWATGSLLPVPLKWGAHHHHVDRISSARSGLSFVFAFDLRKFSGVANLNLQLIKIVSGLVNRPAAIPVAVSQVRSPESYLT
jgi:hypothetical protein